MRRTGICEGACSFSSLPLAAGDQVAGQWRGSSEATPASGSHNLIPVGVAGSTTTRKMRGVEMLVLVTSIHWMRALASGLSISRPRPLNVTSVAVAGRAVTVVLEAPSAHL